MTSYVEIETSKTFPFDIVSLTDILLEAVIDTENCEYEAQINMIVTESEEVKEYNRIYRNIDSTTDVLSFPAIDFTSEGDFSIVAEDESSYFDPDSGELILGDIILNADRVYSQADEYGHSIKREFAFLVTHSLFHLCGYDHMTKEEAEVMERKQEEVLTKLGITRES